MSPTQKAGQLVMVALNSSDPINAADSLIVDGRAGGVLLLGNGWHSAEQVRAVAEHIESLIAPGDAKPYLAADQEGGQVQRLAGPGFSAIPSALAQGAWPADTLTQQAATWGAELKAAGVGLNLAPVADTVPPGFAASNAPIGQLGREFGASPEAAGAGAAAFIAGMNQAGEQTAVKHFPGLGRITGNTDTTASGIADATTTPTDPYLDAYRAAIAAGPAMVMISLATYTQIDPSGPAAFSRAIVTDLLRDQLGWGGVVISDSMGAAAVRSIPASARAVRFVEAGGDMVIMTTAADTQEAIAGLVDQMDQSAQFAAMVDAAVLRVLQAKQAAGLL
ncbi:MAG: hypothetical protein LBQ06_06930 [Frankiaceae bacterium]|jgi:beta-N-acetylhexosaminidase|nr:hypothetical protein [Frankiaceae bacterium]